MSFNQAIAPQTSVAEGTQTQRLTMAAAQSQAAVQGSYYARTEKSELVKHHGTATHPVAHAPGHEVAAQKSYDMSNYANAEEIKPSGYFRKLAHTATIGTTQAPDGDINPTVQDIRAIGFFAADTHTRHTNGCGVAVHHVYRDTPAADSGLQGDDIITHVDGKRIVTMEEFRAAITSGSGIYELKVNRDGKLSVTLSLNLGSTR